MQKIINESQLEDRTWSIGAEKAFFQVDLEYLYYMYFGICVLINMLRYMLLPKVKQLSMTTD